MHRKYKLLYVEILVKIHIFGLINVRHKKRFSKKCNFSTFSNIKKYCRHIDYITYIFGQAR